MALAPILGNVDKDRSMKARSRYQDLPPRSKRRISMQWHKIYESNPPKLKGILVVMEGHGAPFSAWWDGRGFWYSYPNDAPIEKKFRITHWSELPEMP